MKIKSINVNGRIVFENFVVIKKSNTFFEVYENYMTFDSRKCGSPITSGSTLDKACKKAKLLQIGYYIAKDRYQESLRECWLDMED